MQRFFGYALLVVLMVGLVGCGGGVTDTTIPAPPSSSEYQNGQDPILDAAVSSFSQSAANVGTGTTTKFYISTATMDEIKNFYTTEMPKRGWKTIESPAVPNTVSVNFQADANVAAINAIDLTMTGSTGILVITTGTNVK